jgi:hypothetical protein
MLGLHVIAFPGHANQVAAVTIGIFDPTWLLISIRLIQADRP